MYSKLKITATLEVMTGMHIGGSSAYSAIGAVDSPVIRDSLTKRPMIPGSSLKGKMRTLLARTMSENVYLESNDKDPAVIKRLFGSSKASQNGRIIHSRLQFFDLFLSNYNAIKDVGTTEVKFENTINRTTSVANPRQIERVIKGSEFAFSLIYDVVDENEYDEDIESIVLALKLLEMDYLGGHGTRGYGKVGFRDFNAECVLGELSQEKLEFLKTKLKEVE
ncbi:MAG: type III-A CRISPR-associated RAMP protein Csm3 [Saccharofermentanales bacterium]